MNVTSKTHSPYTLETAAIQAAAEVGVRLHNLRESGKGIAFTLKTGEPNEQRINWRGKVQWSPRYQRLSAYPKRSTAKGFEGVEFHSVVPGAVCWHGHRDFLRAFYRLVPDAKIRTAFITYQSAEHFEANYESTWDGPCGKSRGSYAGYARPYQDACTCVDY